MDLSKLKWTKNVKPQRYEGWAWPVEYIPTIYPNLKIFALTWRNLKDRDDKNARTPQEDELMILRQHGRVTHIVKMLNNQLYIDENAGDKFNIYRLVQVMWITNDWQNPPKNDEVFDCPIKFPPCGKAIKLEKLQDFQKRWGRENLSEFHQHIQKVLNINS